MPTGVAPLCSAFGHSLRVVATALGTTAPSDPSARFERHATRVLLIGSHVNTERKFLTEIERKVTWKASKIRELRVYFVRLSVN